MDKGGAKAERGIGVDLKINERVKQQQKKITEH